MQFPEAITVVEVGPRDGLQTLGRWIPTDAKIRMVDRLSEAGLPVIEAAAFASPTAVPMLADAEAVFGGITRRPGTVYRAMAPNQRGLARALEAGADEITALTTVSEAYTRRNQRMSVEEATETAAAVYRGAYQAGRSAVVAVGMALWCPLDGAIAPDRTFAVVRRLHAGGVRRLYLAGSFGREDPRRVGALIRGVRRRWPDLEVGFHAHDTAGFAIGNSLAALDAGASFLEGSIGGLGGGTVYEHSMPHSGNVCTEDLIHVLEVCGIRTGVPTDTINEAALEIGTLLGIEPASRVRLNRRPTVLSI